MEAERGAPRSPRSTGGRPPPRGKIPPRVGSIKFATSAKDTEIFILRYSQKVSSFSNIEAGVQSLYCF